MGLLGKRRRERTVSFSVDDTGRAIKFVKRSRNKDVFIRDPNTSRIEVYTMDCGRRFCTPSTRTPKLDLTPSKLRFTYQGQEISDDIAWATRCGMVNDYVDCHVKNV